MEKLDPKSVETILSLTPLQEGMLFHYLRVPKSQLYFEQLSLEISGAIDGQIFEKAWNIVIETNEMLRTLFHWEKAEKSSQIILKEHKCRVTVYDLSDKNNEQKKMALEVIKNKDRCDTFDLRQVPFRVILARVDETKYEMIISNHHILYDGWSNGIILKEFFNAYHWLEQETQSLKLPAKPHFKEFVRWLQGRDKNKQEQFWRDYLTSLETPAELTIKRRKQETTGSDDYAISLGKDLKNSLNIFAINNRVTLAAVFYSAWGILLQRYCGSEQVIFGTTVSGRSAGVKGIEDMVGLFINTIPLRIDTYADEKIIDMVFRTDNVLREREEFEHTPLVDIRNCSAVTDGSLFDTIMVIENYPLDRGLVPQGSRLAVCSYAIAETTHYDLSVGIMLTGEIEIKLSFKPELFSKEIIENMACHFKGIILNIINNPETTLSQLEIISSEEKNRILNDFNNTTMEYPRDKTIHELFEEQALKTPDYIALVGADEAEEKKSRREEEKNVGTNRHLRVCLVRNVRNVSLTYRQLNEQSGRLAGLLMEKGVLPDMIVAIMMERSIEMVMGIFSILKSGGAYLPIDPRYPKERIKYMLQDSKAEIIFYSEFFKNAPQAPFLHHSSLDIPRVHHSNLAYVIYTSGSTGKPKGVLIEHASVVNRMFWVKERYSLNERDVILQSAPFIFDVSVCELFRWILAGARLCLLPGGSQMDPGLIVKTIDRYGATTADFTPSVINLIIDLLDNYQSFKALASLRWLFTGVEMVSLNLVKRFHETLERFNKTKLINAYGPTESTVDVTYFPCVEDYGMVPIGKPMANVQVYIVDKWGHLQPQGVGGELCIGGKGLARGYLNLPGLTNEKLKIKNENAASCDFYHSSFIHHAKLYYTGDLARWLNDGNIEFIGRVDHQVKIRGFRIEMGEIETRLLKHEKVKEAVILAKEDVAGDKYLAAYFVSDLEITETELREYLARGLPDYMIPSYFVRLEKLPLTFNGKVDRRALPEPELKVDERYTAPRDELEMKLAEIWSEVLGENVLPHRIGIDDNFFQLGGHSLKATTLVLKIHKKFQVNIPLAEIFKTPNIRNLANYIKAAGKSKYISIAAVEKKEYYPMSSAQKRMYIEQGMQSKNKSYNMPAILTLDGQVSHERLKNTFQLLIVRHESLRTSFVMMKGEGMQIIHEHIDFDIGYWESDEKGSQAIIEGFLQPFDLSQAPLLRVGLVKTGETRHLLMIDMHHIISDGVSQKILTEEFAALYNGENLPLVKLQYKDFSEWQNCLFETNYLKNQEEYWLNRFKDNIPILNLPTDYPRPADIISDKGNTIDFYVSEELCKKLYEWVKNTESTVYVFLLAAYNILLAKFTGQTDILVVSPITGRKHNDLENIMGMFVNMLAMRNQPEGEKSFKEFLSEVKTNLLDAYENQEYQFPELTNKLNLQGHMHKNPLLNTVFTMQNIDVKKIDLMSSTSKSSTSADHLKITFYKYDRKISVFDLHLIASESSGRIELSIEYAVELFKESTIRDISRHYLEIIEKVIQNPDSKIKDVKFNANLLALQQKEMADGKDFGF